jgi:hypothetical protein
MGRHKNPQYNRKRLVVAGVAAVTTLGVAVGVGIYGNAFADRGQPAASQECLPAVAAAPPATSSVAPTTSTEAPPPSEAAPPANTPTDTPTDTPTSAPTTTTTEPEQQNGGQPPAPGTVITDTTTEQAKSWGYAAGGLVALNGAKPRGNQPTSPNDYGGPKPPEVAPAVPNADTARTFAGGQACQNQFGPAPTDFVDIRKVRPSNVGQGARPGRGASTGTFVSQCGRNENGHFNSANFIVAPGNVNGAEHTHDYVGNLTTDGFSSNESLAAGGTTCRLGDKSAYFWPVIRVRNKGSKAVDPLNAHNFGDVQRPASVELKFKGSPRGQVVAAPQFLRVLTGNAKSLSQAGVNQNAKWTCTGFENRITAKYPLCPRGSQTVRIADFPGCWDGVNTDSTNHRTHVAFADKAGNCPAGFKAIPQLTITLKYNLPQGKVFALDAFPAEKHAPITDHNDFVNVMPNQLMNRVVQCINTGRRC